MEPEEMQEIIKNEMGVLLYFSGENCNVCHALRPKFKELFETRFPLIRQIYLDAHENSVLSVYFQVFSVPTMILFLDGREFAREGRNVSLDQLAQRVGRLYDILNS